MSQDADISKKAREVAQRRVQKLLKRLLNWDYTNQPQEVIPGATGNGTYYQTLHFDPSERGQEDKAAFMAEVQRRLGVLSPEKKLVKFHERETSREGQPCTELVLTISAGDAMHLDTLVAQEKVAVHQACKVIAQQPIISGQSAVYAIFNRNPYLLSLQRAWIEQRVADQGGTVEVEDIARDGRPGFKMTISNQWALKLHKNATGAISSPPEFVQQRTDEETRYIGVLAKKLLRDTSAWKCDAEKNSYQLVTRPMEDKREVDRLGPAIMRELGNSKHILSRNVERKPGARDEWALTIEVTKESFDAYQAAQAQARKDIAAAARRSATGPKPGAPFSQATPHKRRVHPTHTRNAPDKVSLPPGAVRERGHNRKHLLRSVIEWPLVNGMYEKSILFHNDEEYDHNRELIAPQTRIETYIQKIKTNFYHARIGQERGQPFDHGVTEYKGHQLLTLRIHPEDAAPLAAFMSMHVVQHDASGVQQAPAR